MWNFLPGGALMPSLAPLDLANPKYTHDGKFGLQVRARVRSHIENFTRDFMDDGTYSDIEETVGMDYPFRFYTTKESYGEALKRAVMDIDYVSFKNSSERKYADGTSMYADGSAYHSGLMSVWSAWFSKFGGYFGYVDGEYKERPYKSALSSGKGSYSKYSVYSDKGLGRNRHLFEEEEDYTADDKWWPTHNTGSRNPTAWWNQPRTDAEVAREDEPKDTLAGYTASDEEEANALFKEYGDLPIWDLPDWLSDREMRLLVEFYPRHFDSAFDEKPSVSRKSRNQNKTARSVSKKRRSRKSKRGN